MLSGREQDRLQDVSCGLPRLLRSARDNVKAGFSHVSFCGTLKRQAARYQLELDRRQAQTTPQDVTTFQSFSSWRYDFFIPGWLAWLATARLRKGDMKPRQLNRDATLR
jgi:hypothetical protein